MALGTVFRLVAAIIGLTLITSVVMLQVEWMGEQASTAAPKIDTLLNVMIVLASLVFWVVLVFGVYFAWHYRAKPGDESDGEPIHGNTRLEIVWTLIPTIIVLFGAGYSWVVLNQVEPSAAADALQVDVEGEQFAWTFTYPQEGEEAVSEGELVVPVDRQVEFHLIARDVLHSFWVPEWRIKRDLVPGNEDLPEATVTVTPDKEGTFPLVCAELCGIGHATMRNTVRVVPAEEYEQWIADLVGGEA